MDSDSSGSYPEAIWIHCLLTTLLGCRNTSAKIGSDFKKRQMWEAARLFESINAAKAQLPNTGVESKCFHLLGFILTCNDPTPLTMDPVDDVAGLAKDTPHPLHPSEGET